MRYVVKVCGSEGCVRLSWVRLEEIMLQLGPVSSLPLCSTIYLIVLSHGFTCLMLILSIEQYVFLLSLSGLDCLKTKMGLKGAHMICLFE